MKVFRIWKMPHNQHLRLSQDLWSFLDQFLASCSHLFLSLFYFDIKVKTRVFIITWGNKYVSNVCGGGWGNNEDKYLVRDMQSVNMSKWWRCMSHHRGWARFMTQCKKLMTDFGIISWGCSTCVGIWRGNSRLREIWKKIKFWDKKNTFSESHCLIGMRKRNTKLFLGKVTFQWHLKDLVWNRKLLFTFTQEKSNSWTSSIYFPMAFQIWPWGEVQQRFS